MHILIKVFKIFTCFFTCMLPNDVMSILNYIFYRFMQLVYPV